MARVCAVVLNSVTRDARVQKEARTLAEAGHTVTILGVQDANDRSPETLLENGVKIIRVAVRGEASSNIAVLARATMALLQEAKVFLFGILFLVLSIYGWELTWSQRFDLLYLGSILVFGLVTLYGLIRLFADSKVAMIYREFRSAVVNVLSYIAPALAYRATRQSLLAVQIFEQLEDLKPDVVHCHDVHTLPIGALAKNKHDCKVVYDAHEIYEDLAQGTSGLRRRNKYLHSKYTPCVDAFITINESIAKWYRKHYPSLPEATIVMNAAERADHIDHDGRLHRAAGLPNDTKILLYQGGYSAKRGLERLIQSAEYLPADWKIVMMGWGNLEPHLRSLAAQISERLDGAAPVKFIPPADQRDLVNWTAGATIGIIPYDNVGLNHLYCTPNKLWEYPNAGVPVLVSSLPEMRKLVENYKYGWLLDGGSDPHSLAVQLANLSDGDIDKARSACSEFMKHESWEKYGKRLVSLYAEL